MTSHTSFLTITLLALFVAAGCASPQPISLLEGDSEESKFWHQGQEFLTYTTKGITAEIAYSREAGELYIFDVAVYNETDTELLVDPASFYYRPVRNFQDSLLLVYAEDPESRLLEIDKDLSRLKAEEINQSISSALMATAELTAVVASEVGKSTEEEKDELYQSIEYSTHERNLERTKIELENMNARQQRDFWKSQTLRKTTLFPNQYITGQVFFPRNIKADEVILILPLANKEFSFKYRQELVEVD
ncbi:hypothetical protein [Gracilimonas mengyeensis]|uniref:DUF4369 domain-containing protein n=1 Tax=Gracilimonas mengyeensis TaxID=1302730 RepID=A0A521D8Y5_9BACT|nr:hypothetical protein [Gracilimonas mengyeensis]SMO67561.1 hypothetical protein SAMN06265219_107185 [Gracilimonas mengyeensis]